jgi:uncharacterized membrane protein YccF (DUF307 family)
MIVAAIGNFIWVLTAGWVLGLGWLLAGVAAVVFVITAPIAPAAFRLALFSLVPFGRELIDKRVLDGDSTNTDKSLRAGLNTIWLVLIGWWLAAYMLMGAIVLFVTIIGIPFGIQALKLAGAALWPIGKEIVTKEEARYAKDSSAKSRVDERRAARARSKSPSLPQESTGPALPSDP